MSNNILVAIITVLLISVAIYAIIRAVLITVKDRKKQLEELMNYDKDVIVAVGARVIAKTTYIDYKGTKMPQHNIVYSVEFLTDDGRNIKYDVTKQLFESVHEHDTGKLVTINGNFLDFGKGETIE